MSSSAPTKDHVANLIGLLEGPLTDAHFELVDVECSSIGTASAAVRVFVEYLPSHPIGGRIDLEGVASATRIIDEQLELDDIVPGRYTLEVSSPGLERPLRIPAHFRRYVGHQVMIKTRPGVAGDRRFEGRLVDASLDEDGCVTVDERVIPYADIEKARIVVQWGPPPKPGKVKKSERKPHPKAVEAARLAALANPDASSVPSDMSSSDDELDEDDFDEDEDLLDEDLFADEDQDFEDDFEDDEGEDV
jgi:ribosome maturation factor RimP